MDKNTKSNGVKEMSEMRKINKDLTSADFLSRYYLKQELVIFCRENGLPTCGGKLELTERIADYLDGREYSAVKRKSRPKMRLDELTEESIIEENLVCSEKHRAFFVEKIGKSFSFNVAFQKWLKANAGRTYADAICAYFDILSKKTQDKTIDKQFEYNTYIRDFFSNNRGETLSDAIICWNYKKSLSGNHRYEPSDLKALTGEE